MHPALHYLKSRVAILGLGKSGLSAARALQAVGATVLAWDDNPESRNKAARMGISIAEPSEKNWVGLRSVIWSPGIPSTLPSPHPAALLARRMGIPLVCDVDLLCEAQTDAFVIAITGTNGKSTTTALIGHILEQAGLPVSVGGNIGVPAMELPDMDWRGTYVLELSSYQLELMPHLKANVAVWLNISPDHLDRHGNMDGYIRAKTRVFADQPAHATSIIGVDDPDSARMYETVSRHALHKVIPVRTGRAVTGGIFVADGILFDASEGTPVEICDLRPLKRLPGIHNGQNIACAFAAARARGIAVPVIIEALRTFPGLPHRLELIEDIEGVPFINDSKATNAEATARALACYDRVLWIAGGQAKEGGIQVLRPLFPRIRHAFLIGEAQDLFAQELGQDVPWTKCSDLQNAVERADEIADHGDVVLLSPACASFDQFRNFEHRGEVFRRIVQELAEEESEDVPEGEEAT
ncbi:UDP-N-acetylmuramoyl-L-alanine--D-glutamate ligase [Haematospirillum jordaniae]|uniref:UDP-N-acetylmuramoyl-L-alanine--D-glutamate ligase n=1 Tax=Haematospirillum jordaniae TaxID=1549855 RepID=UPI001432B8B1|nr:UDP-N-acetylmuramoyl-L-alanine--D-glutamate ligase [Haematospirillum jordaniae]NKD85227.1 UDP-N-acetylmuramoyl-L-alanine--D-glutamate ligase [Haematospirillum jordaniae]